jgi:hypothetical protein
MFLTGSPGAWKLFRSQKKFLMGKEKKMKYLKMLGLAAVAATALMVFFGAGSASANTVICKTTATPCPTGWDLGVGETVDASLEGTAILETTMGAVLDTCSAGTVHGTVSTTTTPTVSVPSTGLTWSSCTRTTDTLGPDGGGSIQFHANGDATHTGTVTVRGFFVRVDTVAFGTCIFGFGEEYVPLATATSGEQPTIHINTLVPKILGACPAQVRWTASYKVTTPTTTTIIP